MKTRDGKVLNPVITLHFTRQMLDGEEFNGHVEHGLAMALEAALEENQELKLQLRECTTGRHHWWRGRVKR